MPILVMPISTLFRSFQFSVVGIATIVHLAFF
jgi:hypothetical protein